MNERTEFIKKHLGGIILDLGCGFSKLHEQIDSKNVFGIDLNPKCIRERVVRGDVQELPFESENFAVLVGGEIIEHLPNPERFLKECWRTLKKGGKLILTTPNRNAWSNKLFKNFEHNDGSGINEHLRIFTKKELFLLLENNGFWVEEYFCLPYDKISSPNQSGWVYFVRRIIHYFLPQGLQEEQIVLAKKVQKEKGSL